MRNRENQQKYRKKSYGPVRALAFLCAVFLLTGCAEGVTPQESELPQYSSGSTAEEPDASAPGAPDAPGTSDASGDQAVSGTPEEPGAPEVLETSESDREEAAAPISSPTDYVTEEMYQRAIAFQQGDLTRLAAVMRRAQAGEDITVGVIGGSITEGYSASNRNKSSYACHMRDWWQERFPESTVEYVNAGIGGTSSYLGVHRVQEDLLDYEPDFVIVEFSVNDGATNFYKRSYDNLLRRILLDENMPALMLLFTTQENGTSAQVNDALLGFGYELPMISYGNAVLPAIEAGEFTWKDISPDNIHPNDRGHAVIGELLYRYLNDVYARLDEIPEEITPFTAKAQTVERYMAGRILDASNLTPVSAGSFTDIQSGWYFPYEDYWYTETGEESLVFEIEAANIGMLYQRDVSDAFGQFDVYIDGEHVRTLDGYFENGWGNSMETVELYTSDEIAVHRVEVRKNPDSVGNKFTVIGWLVS